MTARAQRAALALLLSGNRKQDQELSRRDGASHLSLLVQRNLAQRKHTPPSRPARCESSRLKPLPQLCGQPPYRVAANRSNAPMPSSTVTRSITPSCSIFAPHFNSL